MIFEVITELDVCKELWEKYAPKESLWDEWVIAKSFYEKEHYELYFLLFKDESGKELGLMPLYLSKENNTYYFFGEGFPEMKKFWFKQELIPKVIELLPKPTKIFDMKGERIEKLIRTYPDLKKYFSDEDKDTRFYLDLKSLNHELDNYLALFNKKHRKNFLYDMKKLDEILQPEIVWEQLEHHDQFVEFNISRFGKESDLSDEQFARELKYFLEAVRDMGIMHTLTIVKNGKIEGIEIAAFYKNNYYVLNGGYNREIKNLGKKLIFEHIKKAMELKADEIDLLVGDTGWKELWNFQKDICYTFKKE